VHQFTRELEDYFRTQLRGSPLSGWLPSGDPSGPGSFTDITEHQRNRDE
jgi:hypothetical protein